ncbi:MAG: KpsF/GutQ family sugar-phosphate isomerase [Phycisphaerales bacterium]|nr:KpsF/GutQ family sugar-phosphate isomerase [Phycisphaerales bacterium]
MASRPESPTGSTLKARRAPIQVEVRRADLSANQPREAAFARRLLEAEATAIRAVSDALGPAFHTAVGLVVGCADADGNVLVSGLGKSGLIGQKISATLSSLAIPSHFVHPAEAAHGDLGRFRPADVCILLSYSGETTEVINLAAMLRQDRIRLIGICRGTPDRSSHLEKLCDVTLTIGDCDDPALTPAPTCSTTATLALGDALALCAARRRNFTEDDFAKRHPGGTLGEMLRPVTDILRFVVGRNIVPVRDNLSVRDALATADNSGVRRPGALLLTDPRAGTLTGIFTDADLRRLIERDLSDLDRPIRDLMTRAPQVLPSSALVRDAVQLVRESRRDEIPVVDESGRPVGVLDVQDLVALRLVQSD